MTRLDGEVEGLPEDSGDAKGGGGDCHGLGAEAHGGEQWEIWDSWGAVKLQINTGLDVAMDSLVSCSEKREAMWER